MNTPWRTPSIEVTGKGNVVHAQKDKPTKAISTTIQGQAMA
jgi:hypothetical protein